MRLEWIFGLFFLLALIGSQFVPKQPSPQCLNKVKVIKIEAVRTNKSWFTGIDHQLYETHKLEYSVGDELCTDTLLKVTK